MKGIRADSSFVHSKFTRAAGGVTTGIAVFVDGGPSRLGPGAFHACNHQHTATGPRRGLHPCPWPRATGQSRWAGGPPPPREPQPAAQRNACPPAGRPVLLLAVANNGCDRRVQSESQRIRNRAPGGRGFTLMHRGPRPGQDGALAHWLAAMHQQGLPGVACMPASCTRHWCWSAWSRRRLRAGERGCGDRRGVIGHPSRPRLFA